MKYNEKPNQEKKLQNYILEQEKISKIGGEVINIFITNTLTFDEVINVLKFINGYLKDKF